MLHYFQSLKGYFKLRLDKACIDNKFCKLHYRYTTTILLAGCILVGTKEILGQDIACDTEDQDISEDYLNQYCYYQHVYTIVNKSDHGEPMRESFLGMGDETPDHERRYHVYYQWVAITLFLQAIFFYLPHFFWKQGEGGRIKILVDGLELAEYSHTDEDISGNSFKFNIPSMQTVNIKIDVIKKYVVLRFHTHSWSLGLVTYEMVNLMNVMLQVYLTNVFLDGLFMRIGYVVTEPYFLVNGIRYPPMSKIFPRLASCAYQNSGDTTSDIQNSTFTCVLLQNSTNDKVYITLWYWYIILFICSVLGVIWRLTTMVLYKSRWFNRSQFNRRDNPPQLYQIAELCNFSDWLFLSYMHKNTSRAIFADIVTSVADELTDLHSPSRPASSGYDNSGYDSTPRQSTAFGAAGIFRQIL